MVTKVEIGDHGLATGVVYAGGVEHFQRARMVAVAGYSIETPRLLLLSASNRFPDGLCNGEGQVGRYVMVQGAPQTAGRFAGEIRMFKAPPPEVSSEHYYETDPTKDYRRGFSIQTVSPLPITWDEHVAAQGHWGEGRQVALILLVFVAPLQALSSIFGFLARDSVGGTGMGLLAGTWLATGAVMVASPAGSTSRALGVLLFFVSAALLVPAVAASLGKVLAAIVMFGAAVRFALTGIYELADRTGWEHVSGWWGIGLGALALYAALAFEIEDTRRHTVLPVGRHGAGRAALNGTIGDDLKQVHHEAGVREQL